MNKLNFKLPFKISLYIIYRYTPQTKYGILKLLKEKKIKMTENVARDLPSESKSMAITHDGWSSCATESYSTVTGHFISRAWELRSVVLHTQHVQGSHTGERIADGLRGIFMPPRSKIGGHIVFVLSVILSFRHSVILSFCNSVILSSSLKL